MREAVIGAISRTAAAASIALAGVVRGGLPRRGCGLPRRRCGQPHQRGGTCRPGPRIAAARSARASRSCVGIRNSFGMTFDPFSGDLWEQENGDDSFSGSPRRAGLSQPVQMEWIGDDDFLVLEKATGQVKRIRDGGAPDRARSTVHWPPENIAATPEEAAERLFRLRGYRFSDPTLPADNADLARRPVIDFARPRSGRVDADRRPVAQRGANVPAGSGATSSRHPPRRRKRIDPDGKAYADQSPTQPARRHDAERVAALRRRPSARRPPSGRARPTPALRRVVLAGHDLRDRPGVAHRGRPAAPRRRPRASLRCRSAARRGRPGRCWPAGRCRPGRPRRERAWCSRA